MRKFFINALIFSSAASALAVGHNALDLQSRVSLRREALKPAARKKISKINKDQAAKQDLSYGFVWVSSEQEVLEFKKAGGQILSRRGNILLAEMPTDSVESIAAIPGMKRVQLARPMDMKMDRARSLSGIDKIHKGTDLPQSYTGKGVITGIVDSGVDPNHINFQDADGGTRIKHFTYIRPSKDGRDMVVSIYEPDQLSNFTTDDPTSYHGTHTMGIMAGGYKNKIKIGDGLDKGGTTTTRNPYYGVATGSDIVASCGQLNDMFIAYGIEYMAEYAYKQQKPLVVNLSLGSNLGTHDGLGVMSQYLDAMSKQDNILFCISAGNEGDMNIALNKTFAAEDTVVRTFIRPTVFTTADKTIRYGQIEIYSNDSIPFDTQLVMWNTKRNRAALRMGAEGSPDAIGHYWVSSKDYATTDADIISPELAKGFQGYVGFGSLLDEVSGRYITIVDYMTFNDSTYNNNNQYLLGLEIKGKPGQRIDAYCDGVYTDLSSYEIDGWQSGSTDGSISDMACTKSALAVGSYNVRNDWFSLDGYKYGYDNYFVGNGVSEFTSHGLLPDGRRLPHLCAPGATIISSTSTPFVMDGQNGIGPAYLQGCTTDEQYFWEHMVGTSMASPVVAGAVALWLEANPKLTPEEIKEIAISTCSKDADYDANNLRWGAGKFDAYAGLKKVLSDLSAINSPEADTIRPIVEMHGKFVVVFMAGASETECTLFDMIGREVASSKSVGSDASLDCSSVPSGIYVLKVNGHSMKINIK